MSEAEVLRKLIRGRSREEQAFRAGMVLGASFMYGRMGGSLDDIDYGALIPPESAMIEQWARWLGALREDEEKRR